MAEGKNAILIGMSQWNSNDLVEQIETIGKLEEHQGEIQFCSNQSVHIHMLQSRKYWQFREDLDHL